MVGGREAGMGYDDAIGLKNDAADARVANRGAHVRRILLSAAASSNLAVNAHPENCT
jgi:hypothetical protein